MRSPWRLALLLMVLVGGCGYHRPGQGDGWPPEVRTLQVELLANHTAEPFLEHAVTEAVIRRLQQLGKAQLVEEPQQADAVLSGAVTSYASTPVAYDRNDLIASFRSRLAVKAVLRRSSDGKVLWKGEVAWHEDYAAATDLVVQEDAETAAVQVAAERLAEELFQRLLDDF